MASSDQSGDDNSALIAQSLNAFDNVASVDQSGDMNVAVVDMDGHTFDMVTVVQSGDNNFANYNN
jgi:hypothetical protein